MTVGTGATVGLGIDIEWVGLGAGAVGGSMEAVGVGGNAVSTAAWISATTFSSKLGVGTTGFELSPQPAARPSSKRGAMSNFALLVNMLLA